MSPLIGGGAQRTELVRDDLFSLTDEAEMGHIELSRACDLIVVAPATAHTSWRAWPQGLANDLATTTLLATDKRVLVGPRHERAACGCNPATQPQPRRSLSDGRRSAFVGPESRADMACGEFGPGRMADPLAIVAAIERELLSRRIANSGRSARSAHP